MEDSTMTKIFTLQEALNNLNTTVHKTRNKKEKPTNPLYEIYNNILNVESKDDIENIITQALLQNSNLK